MALEYRGEKLNKPTRSKFIRCDGCGKLFPATTNDTTLTPANSRRCDTCGGTTFTQVTLRDPAMEHA